MATQDTVTVTDIAAKRGVTPERARQIALKLGAKKVDGKYVVSAAKFDNWMATARKKPTSSKRKQRTAKKTAPAVTVQSNGVSSGNLVLDVLQDRSLDDKTARKFATYLARKQAK